MPKEIYIYSPIYDETAKIINQSLSDVPESEDVLYRINSPGGYTRAGFSILSKMSERSGKNNAIIDGDAMSMGAYLLPFFDDVTSNDTSDLMFHIAAYPSWYEPTEEEKQALDRTNNKFKEKLSKKVEGKPGAKKFLDKVTVELVELPAVAKFAIAREEKAKKTAEEKKKEKEEKKKAAEEAAKKEEKPAEEKKEEKKIEKEEKDLLKKETKEVREMEKAKGKEVKHISADKKVQVQRKALAK